MVMNGTMMCINILFLLMQCVCAADKGHGSQLLTSWTSQVGGRRDGLIAAVVVKSGSALAATCSSSSTSSHQLTPSFSYHVLSRFFIGLLDSLTRAYHMPSKGNAPKNDFLS